MEFKLNILMNNAAFSDENGGANGVEVARILRDLADRIDSHPHFSDGHSQPVFDTNGHSVGGFSVTEVSQ